MPKRRTRITPKIRKKPRKDSNLSSQSNSTSSDSVDESKGESSGSSKAVTAQPDVSKATRSPAKRASSKTRKVTAKPDSRRRTNSNRIRDLTVSKSAFAKWKPLNPSTKKFVLQILADTQLNIVSQVINDDKKDHTQHCLQNLQKRIIDKLECLRGPDNKLNYKQLESETKSMEEVLNTINSQLLPIESELEEEKSLLKADEEQEKHYENNTTNAEHNIQDIIPATSTSLNLTKLSKESLDRPIPKIPTDLGKAAETLQAALAMKKQKLEEAGFRSWVESLCQVLSQVNSSPLS